MKKIIVIIICFIFVYGGCKANINDAYKMINNINKVGNEEIFDDYYIKGISYNNDSVFNYELIKDNDNYYIKIEKDDFYIIKNNNDQRTFMAIGQEYNLISYSELMNQDFLSIIWLKRKYTFE